MTKVSVIIPNYNHERFLEKRIRSVLEQTYQSFEVICLDDASTDQSNQVLAKFLSDRRIQAIYNTVNSGSPFKQWEKGLQIAKGEYIWIAESDDYANAKFLETLVAILDQNPNVGLVYSQSWGVDENDRVIRNWKTWTDDLDSDRWSQNFINSGNDECRQYLLFKNTIPNASAVLMRRSVLEKTGKIDTQMRLAGDWLLWSKMLIISDIAFVAEPLNNFRTHTNVVRNTSKPSLELEERLQVISYISQKVDIPHNFWETVFNTSIGWWIRMIFLGEVAFSRSHKIYNSLREVDPNINYRLLTILLKALKNKLSLYT
jgi:glycosyltransferase involved in cell wall biosynthesis